MKLTSIAIVGFLICFHGFIVLAQDNVLNVQERADHAHLIGHEDELLLRRIEDAIAEWDPRNLDSPYLKVINTVTGKKFALRRPDLAEFIADSDAAVVLGKALFWEMQAGSDYGLKDSADKTYGTACASCHYRFGADARSRNTEAIAFQAWEKFVQDRPGSVPNPGPDLRVERPAFTQRNLAFQPEGGSDIDPKKFNTAGPGLLQHEIVGSQGIKLRRYEGIDGNGIEKSTQIDLPPSSFQRHDMFATSPTTRSRQVTPRNSPTVINSVFNDRQFHDGRAESTFNGFSVFGDFDKRVILKKAVLGADGAAKSYTPVSMAIVNASLGSQAVGPIVNEVEMSYKGRTFHDIAARLLTAQPLAQQEVHIDDGVLGPYANQGNCGLYEPSDKTKALTYRQLIQRAFRKEWWADEAKISQQVAYRAQLDKARLKLEALVATLPAEHSAIKTSIETILAQPIQFKANAIVAAIEQTYEDPALVPAIKKLLDTADAWNLVEGEILPLRLRLSENPSEQETRRNVDELLAIMKTGGPNDLTAQDDLMVNNFSLYWGLSIMLYESTLVSNHSPFDQMLRGDSSSVEAVWNGDMGQTIGALIEPDGNSVKPDEPLNDDSIRKSQLDKIPNKNALPVLTGTAMFQRGMRVFMLNCSECHTPPFFTSAAALELAPELPEPIAKLHAHALVRNALTDAFKERLISANQPRGKGVTTDNRKFLGARRYFFDQERLPEVEATVAPLLIELMGVPDKRPISFTTVPALPGDPNPDRNPMITWVGTRPVFEFAPSPQPGAKPIAPYAFYDLGFYNLGLTEPRYDWGVWGFAESDQELFFTESELDAAFQLAPTEISSEAVAVMKQQTTQRQLEQPAESGQSSSIPSLGSAYRLPRTTRRESRIEQAKEALQTITGILESTSTAANILNVDHSAERDYLSTASRVLRKDHHFFKRARRMVMSEENWGHRKPFISDNELMGWGAFKTPSLRNVALTEPYMRNGRFLTLRQVLEFYSFDNPDLIPANVTLNPDLHPEMGRLLFNSDGKVFGLPNLPINLVQIQDAESLLFFLHCLTDNRVRLQAAPFDHPSIRLPNGFNGNDPENENVISIASVGSSGTPNDIPHQFPANN